MYIYLLPCLMLLFPETPQILSPHVSAPLLHVLLSSLVFHIFCHRLSVCIMSSLNLGTMSCSLLYGEALE